MATLESLVATRLRADTVLATILTGGIYTSGELGTEGLTNPKTTPGVYAAGLLKPCCIVKAGGEVDDPRIVDEEEQIVGESLTVQCWLYERVTRVAIEAAKARIYALLQDKPFTGTWGPKRGFTLATTPAPEFSGVNVSRVDYVIPSVKRPA